MQNKPIASKMDNNQYADVIHERHVAGLIRLLKTHLRYEDLDSHLVCLLLLHVFFITSDETSSGQNLIVGLPQSCQQGYLAVAFKDPGQAVTST